MEADMDLRAVGESESRFSAYVEGLVSVIGHADRASPLRDYCLGLMIPCERKSVEPMAAVTAPGRTAAQHQSLLHFVGNAAWSDEKVLAKTRDMVLPAIERQGPIEAWIIDDTGFPKKGEHSVGVTRQYCGQLGKQDNCQVAVSPASCRRPQCGRKGLDRCRRRSGPGKGDQRSSSAGTPSINRSRSSNSLSVCPSALGARSGGGRVRPKGCPRVLRGYAFGSRIAITISPRAERKSGC